MKKENSLYLDDIIKAISKIERYAGNMDFEAFKGGSK